LHDILDIFYVALHRVLIMAASPTRLVKFYFHPIVERVVVSSFASLV